MNIDKLIEKANILAEALPYINKLAKKTVVIKYGGNAMNSENEQSILQDIAMLKVVGVNPILVHGGGPEINSMLEKLDIKSQFHNGLRVTSKDAIEVVQMVLCGKLNKDITARMNNLGVKAIGICGKDAHLIEAEKKKSEGVDLGYVGEITNINTKLLSLLISDEFIPVVAPIGADSQQNSYNINADTAAAEIAIALKAEKLIYLTDIDGIYKNINDKSSLIHFASIAELQKMIENEEINGGMIPKVKACMQGVESGINCVHIINGNIPHSVMLEIFTDSGIGTMITR
ncbi:MAG: acetylglutamate kinase [Bacillota bacterium]|jgi:acetylglutamate kinase|nr:acetylglutamate kinase [Bacillota bacterium]HHU43866.1 acetylglutamate kinase [Clostridiales bacterium]